MKVQSKEDKKANRETKFNSFCCTSGFLLSVVCCIALIHVELKLQEHHRVISQSATFCDQMKKEVLQEVQQNYGRWQINKDRNSEGTWHEAQGKVIIFNLTPGEEYSLIRTIHYTVYYTCCAIGYGFGGARSVLE